MWRTLLALKYRYNSGRSTELQAEAPWLKAVRESLVRHTTQHRGTITAVRLDDIIPKIDESYLFLTGNKIGP